jgi:O-antigen/teichoic acid export membrane protein
VTDADGRPGLLGQVRKLAGHSVVYGSADVFVNVVNFLLVPVYTAYLAPSQYGTLALLILFSTVAKILFRLGLDSGFFRVHYDLATAEEQRRLAGTVALFAGAVGTVLFAAVVLVSPAIARLLLGVDGRPSLVVLAAADVYLGTFAFVPLNLLRIQDRSALFSTLSAVRHTVNTVLKVVLVVSGWGVAGILWSDLVATAVFVLALLPVLRRYASLALSGRALREVLAFSLPKVPHGLMVQLQNFADRKILDLFVSRAELGIYQVGYTFGTAVRFAGAAFEPAWGPFVYSQLGKKDAPATLGRVATYAWAVIATLGLGLAVLGRELLMVMTWRRPEYWAAAPVVPVVTLAYVLHGGFLLTSIGIGISKKARYYPLITAAAAGTNLAANFLLIPRWGIMGAAWATVASYAVMAAMGFAISRRLYPIPFEAGRIARLAGAAALTWALSLLAPAALGSAVVVKLAVLGAFPLLLLASGFLSASERGWLRRHLGRRSGLAGD